MLQFIPQVKAFIQSQHAAVLAVPLPDNAVHAAAMLFSFDLNLAEFYFFTEAGSIKLRPLETRSTCNASLVIGTTEENKLTLQLSGILAKVEQFDTLEKIKIVHYARFPQSKAYENATTVFLCFTPIWYRFTDYHTKPPQIISSS